MATDSSHGHGEAAVLRQLSSVVVTLSVSASHTSTRLRPSNVTTVSSGVVIIATRLPSGVTENSRTFRTVPITSSVRFPTTRNISDTVRLPWPYSSVLNFL